MSFFLGLKIFGFISFDFAEKNHSSVVFASPVLIINHSSSEVSEIPTVNVSLFSSKISSSFLLEVPRKCLKIFFGL